MADNETIADIIAEKRRDAQHIRNNLSTVPVRRLDQLAEIKSLADEADRLEAAHKRERGDCAKLREALQSCLDTICRIVWIDDPVYDKDGHYLGANYAAVSRDKARAALAAPPRNCDIVPIEAREAADMFHRERPLHGYDYETHDWLLSPATEKEGVNDADK